MDLTKYELARIIGARAFQLSQGAPPLVKVESEMDFIQVAQKELDEKVVPLVVVREA
jgi:DNA-directed RNA polymerase subunit K